MIDFILKYWVEFLLTTLTGGVIYVFKQYIGLKQGMQSLLRNEIVRIYDVQMKLGYCPSFMKENIKDMYESYHLLKGNGLVTSMVNQLYERENYKCSSFTIKSEIHYNATIIWSVFLFISNRENKYR